MINFSHSFGTDTMIDSRWNLSKGSLIAETKGGWRVALRRPMLLNAPVICLSLDLLAAPDVPDPEVRDWPTLVEESVEGVEGCDEDEDEEEEEDEEAANTGPMREGSPSWRGREKPLTGAFGRTIGLREGDEAPERSLLPWLLRRSRKLALMSRTSMWERGT